MKRTSIITNLSLLTAGGLSAQQGPQNGPKGDRRPSPQEMLERFDVNEDGVIELEEIETVTEERRAQGQAFRQRWQESDDSASDDDPGYGPQRGQGPRRDPAQMAEKVIAEFDADGDGQLNQEELQEFFPTMQQLRAQWGGPRGPKGGPGGARGKQAPVQE